MTFHPGLDRSCVNQPIGGIAWNVAGRLTAIYTTRSWRRSADPVAGAWWSERPE